MDQPAGDRLSADIWIAGLGMRASHLTPETASVLRASSKVLYLSHAPGVRELLSGYCPDVVDLAALYEDGHDRLATYKRMAAAVIDAALQSPPVSLAVYGNPLVLSVPSTILLRLGSEFGLTVKALPAVSALDCLQADLGVDLVASGVQMHEATDLLLYRRKLLPELATVLWQVGALETRLYTGDSPSLPTQLVRLRDWVCDYYPRDHEATAISSAVHASTGAELYSFRLQALPEMASRFHLGTTVYIPPVASLALPDPDVMRDLVTLSPPGSQPEGRQDQP